MKAKTRATNLVGDRALNDRLSCKNAVGCQGICPRYDCKPAAKVAELAVRISSWPRLLLESLRSVGNQTGLTKVLHHMKITMPSSTGIRKSKKKKKSNILKVHGQAEVRIWRLIHR